MGEGLNMNNRTIGMVLVGVGVFFALGALGVIQATMGLLWPLFLLLPGAWMLMQFYSNPEHGRPALLIPGSILVVYGGLFFGNVLFDWMRLLWPLFILGPALGLFQFYLFTGRNVFLLIPVLVLTLVGGIFLLGNILSNGIGIVIGAVLIAGGVYLLSGKGKTRDEFF
jgi:hypothetical protein